MDSLIDWPYENFTKEEFACKCPRDCDMKDGGKMDPGFMRDLQISREVHGEPVYVVSGLRCVWWNKQEGGKDDSAHLTGNGADLECKNSRPRWNLVGVLRGLFRRIGIAKTFIHIDNLPESKKVQDVLWVY